MLIETRDGADYSKKVWDIAKKTGLLSAEWAGGLMELRSGVNGTPHPAQGYLRRPSPTRGEGKGKRLLAALAVSARIEI